MIFNLELKCTAQFLSSLPTPLCFKHLTSKAYQLRKDCVGVKDLSGLKGLFLLLTASIGPLTRTYSMSCSLPTGLLPAPSPCHCATVTEEPVQGPDRKAT